MVSEHHGAVFAAIGSIVSGPEFYDMDVVATVALSVSGAIIAALEGYSLYGALVLAALPAVGGGVLRDLIAGRTPIDLMEEPTRIELVIVTVLAGYVFNLLVHRMSGRSLLFFDLVNIYVRLKRRIDPRIALEVMDALGMAALTVSGVHVALMVDSEPLWLWGPVFSAVTTTGGFVCRDAIRSDRSMEVLKTMVYGEIAVTWALLLSLLIYFGANSLSHTAVYAAVVVTAVGAFATRCVCMARGFTSNPYRGTARRPSADDP